MPLIPDDQRDRYLSEDELRRLKQVLDDKTYCKGTKKLNKTFYRLRLIVLIAVTTGMRAAEIFGLCRSDVMCGEGLLAVRAKLKAGKMRYVPMPVELAGELRRFPVVIGEDRVLPPKAGATSGRQRVEGSFRGPDRESGHRELPLSRSPSPIRVLVHDEWRRSLRARENPRPLEYQDDRTLCQAGAAAHRQDRQHGAGNLEADGIEECRTSERRLRMFGYLRLTETSRLGRR